MPTRRLSELLCLLVLTDVLLVVVHLLHTFGVSPAHFADPAFSLQQWRGFAEVVQYLKEYWIAAAFALLAAARREARHLVLSGVFAYLLVDDAFELHEQVGRGLAERLALPAVAGVRGSDLGELAVQGVVGVVVATAVAVAYRRGSPTFRATALRLLAMIGALAFFGVVVDLLHSAVGDVPYAYGAFTLLEEGGELVAMSVIAWYACSLLADARAAGRAGRMAAPPGAGSSARVPAARPAAASLRGTDGRGMSSPSA